MLRKTFVLSAFRESETTASMRPQRNAAENISKGVISNTQLARFNEAAA